MFGIEKEVNGQSIVLKLSGKLNSVTAADFHDAALQSASECSELILDFANLQYIASAGLRVVLETHKEMQATGKSLVLSNVDEGTMDILKSTGLTRFLNIK